MTGLWRILLRMKANYADKREKNFNQTMFFFTSNSKPSLSKKSTPIPDSFSASFPYE